jgi:hypothetical protein
MQHKVGYDFENSWGKITEGETASLGVVTDKIVSAFQVCFTID